MCFCEQKCWKLVPDLFDLVLALHPAKPYLVKSLDHPLIPFHFNRNHLLRQALNEHPLLFE